MKPFRFTGARSKSIPEISLLRPGSTRHVKLYVSADMEGTAGVCAWPQVDPSNATEFAIYRRYMTLEVAAAIQGAREAVTTEVVINDAHWDMRNVLWDDLPEDVRVITGSRKPLSMAAGAEQRFDAAFFTGYHAKIGDANGILAHTYNDDVLYNVSINGTLCSEALLNAAVLGVYGTPVVLVTGDRRIVEETLEHLPWAVGVAVKDGIGTHAADSLVPEAARTAIRDGARQAIAAISAAKPFTFAPPIELLIETLRTEHADFIELLPGFERTGGRAVRFAADDYLTAFRAFLVATRLGGAANRCA